MGRQTGIGSLGKLGLLLNSHGFVSQTACTLNGVKWPLYRFGTAGALVRRNILQEWWDYMVAKQENTFPVEAGVISPYSSNSSSLVLLDKLMEKKDIQNDCSLRFSLSKDLLLHYLTTLQLMNKKLPFAIAQVGPCLNETYDPDHEEKILMGSLCNTHMINQHYCPPGSVSQTFDHWLSFRLRWWKQFSSNPSNFVTTDSQQLQNGSTRSLIQYRFPWGLDTIETVCNHGDGDLREMEKDSEVSYQGRVGRKTVLPHIIECETRLEAAMTAYLVDAFREKHNFVSSTAKGNKTKEPQLVLQLHPHLAPYQVATATTGSKSRELRHVTKHLAGEFRESGITVLDSSDTTATLELLFRRNDELGVPYTIVLNDQTLDTGLVGLRNRDTMLREQVHLTKLKDTLLEYLKPV